MRFHCFGLLNVYNLPFSLLHPANTNKFSCLKTGSTRTRRWWWWTRWKSPTFFKYKKCIVGFCSEFHIFEINLKGCKWYFLPLFHTMGVYALVWNINLSVCYTASNRLRRVRIRFHLSQIIYFILHHRIGKQMLMHPQFNYLLLVDEGAKNTKRLGDNENEITIWNWKVASNLLEQICKSNCNWCEVGTFQFQFQFQWYSICHVNCSWLNNQHHNVFVNFKWKPNFEVIWFSICTKGPNISLKERIICLIPTIEFNRNEHIQLKFVFVVVIYTWKHH